MCVCKCKHKHTNIYLCCRYACLFTHLSSCAVLLVHWVPSAQALFYYIWHVPFISRLISKWKEACVSCLRLSFCQSGQGYELLMCFMKISHQVKERVLLMNISPWLASRAFSQIGMLQMHPSEEKIQEWVQETNLLGPGSLQPVAHRAISNFLPPGWQAQLTLCCQGTPLSLAVRREDPHSQLRWVPGLREDPLPLPSPLSVSRTHVLFPCVRKFPTVTLSLSLLPGPHASASASVSGLRYNYGLLCSHPHCLSKVPRFKHSCKSVSQSHGASN